MKIEKLNDNQIRCTLTRADLAARHLKLSELAYGTEKAKLLFRDMMQQASFDFGFEVDDTPLMIEAIPASSDSIVLIITKVDDPEELDTRFSRFTSAGTGEFNMEHLEKLEGAEDFLNLLNKVKKAAADITSAPDSAKPNETDQSEAPAFNVRLFSFGTIDLVLQASQLISPIYDGSNTLYLDPEEDVYILALTQAEDAGNEFSKICNMLSEYGTPEKASAAVLAFLEEHCETIVSMKAVQKLASI